MNKKQSQASCISIFNEAVSSDFELLKNVFVLRFQFAILIANMRSKNACLLCYCSISIFSVAYWEDEENTQVNLLQDGGRSHLHIPKRIEHTATCSSWCADHTYRLLEACFVYPSHLFNCRYVLLLTFFVAKILSFIYITTLVLLPRLLGVK